jgi:hypothetical protein
LGRELLDAINDEELNNWEEIKIYQQKKKADIVVVIPSQKKIIIIEDKVYSSEHDNQIETYKKEFENPNTQKEELGIETDNPYKVFTVYLKTGFFYDADKLVKADYIINGKKFYDIVSKPQYIGKSEILDCYKELLAERLRWYAEHSNIPEKKDGKYHLSEENYTQYCLMRYIFPENMWDKQKRAYKVEVDSSRGRQYTQMRIDDEYVYPSSNDTYQLFWRIDSSVHGPYISLRFYEWIDKSDTDRKNRHEKQYKRLDRMVHDVFENIEKPLKIVWEDVKDRNKGKYNESALMTIYLEKYLETWNETGELLSEFIRNFTSQVKKQMRLFE